MKTHFIYVHLSNGFIKSLLRVRKNKMSINVMFFEFSGLLIKFDISKYQLYQFSIAKPPSKLKVEVFLSTYMAEIII